MLVGPWGRRGDRLLGIVLRSLLGIDHFILRTLLRGETHSRSQSLQFTGEETEARTSSRQ